MALRLVVRTVVNFVAGVFIKSPLERDYGAASVDDIQLPDASCFAVLPLGEVFEPLIDLYSSIDGLSPGHVKKIGLRLTELPIGKVADYRYQVKDGDATVELQLVMTKGAGDEIDMCFRSSEKVIAAVRASFDLDEDADDAAEFDG